MEDATKKFKEISEAYEVLSDGKYCSDDCQINYNLKAVLLKVL